MIVSLFDLVAILFASIILFWYLKSVPTHDSEGRILVPFCPSASDLAARNWYEGIVHDLVKDNARYMLACDAVFNPHAEVCRDLSLFGLSGINQVLDLDGHTLSLAKDYGFNG